MRKCVQDNMEMMTMKMMMELDKLPDPFSMPFQEISEFPDIEFSGGSTTSTESPPSMQFHSPPPVTNAPSQLAPIFELSHASNYSLQDNPNTSSVEPMREMIFRIAAMQPVQIDPESVKPPKRKNVKISKDPQSVAARHRRERISERIRILQRLVPGGTKMDTASMLDEAVQYMKFLKKQVQSLEQQAAAGNMPITMGGNMGFVGNYPTTMNYSPLINKACGQPTSSQMVGSMHLLR